MINSINTLYTYRYQSAGISNASGSNSTSATMKQPASTSTGAASELAQSAKITISEEALEKLGLSQQTGTTSESQSSSEANGLTEEETQEVKDLQARDEEVRDHEQAHMMAGGSLVRGGASYEYQTGPDGKRYAVGGEVSIDTSAVDDDPEATITKMQQVRRAALAPAEPSGQDRSVASSASRKEAEARSELMQESAQS